MFNHIDLLIKRAVIALVYEVQSVPNAEISELLIFAEGFSSQSETALKKRLLSREILKVGWKAFYALSFK